MTLPGTERGRVQALAPLGRIPKGVRVQFAENPGARRWPKQKADRRTEVEALRSVPGVLRTICRFEPFRPCFLNVAPELRFTLPVRAVRVVELNLDHLHQEQTIPRMRPYPVQMAAFPDISGDRKVRTFSDPVTAWNLSPFSVVIAFRCDKKIIHRHDRGNCPGFYELFDSRFVVHYALIGRVRRFAQGFHSGKGAKRVVRGTSQRFRAAWRALAKKFRAVPNAYETNPQ
jgi:hypothetical protein